MELLKKVLNAWQREMHHESAVLLSLQLLLPRQIRVTADMLMALMRSQHPSLAQTRAEVFNGNIAPNVMQMGRVHWDHHVVQVTLVDAPMSAEAMENTVAISHYAAELKAQAQAHAAHVVLLYRGQEQDPLEQYLALAMVAVALAPLGAFVVVNASAYASLPLQLLVPRPGEDLDQLLRSLPLPSLFVGFVTMQAVEDEGIWIRTCGAHLMDLPDLALHAPGTAETASTMHLFNAMLHTMRELDVRFSEGDMMEDGDLNWTLRKPRINERFLDSPRMLVLVPKR